MIMHLSRYAPLLTALIFAACGQPSGPTLIALDAIDVSENPRPCMFVVNGDWEGAAAKEQFANVQTDDQCKLTLPEGWHEVEIIAAPLQAVDGKPTRIPKTRKEARDYSGYMEESRLIRRGDPVLHLFILLKKAGG